MAKDVGYDLQVKYFQLLNGNITHSSAVVAVYDEPPVSPVYPFIQFGFRTAVDYVTKQDFGQEVTFTLWVVDRFSGNAGNRDKINAITTEITKIIRGRPVFTMAGWNVVTSTLEIINFSKEPTDTYTYWRNEVRFRHKIQQTT